MEIINGIEMKILSLLGNTFSMELPSEFTDMNEILVKEKYPSEMRPKEVKTNKDGSAHYKFNFIDEKVDPELIPTLVKEVKNSLKNIYTGLKFYEDGIITANKKDVIWFEFTSPSVEEDLYNIMFFIYIKEKVMNGSFCCMLKDSVQWRSIILENIRTIKEL